MTFKHHELVAAMPDEPDSELLRALPCLTCRDPRAQAARDEIGWTFVSIRYGQTAAMATRDGDPKPSRCCRRRSGKVDVTTLVA